MHNKFILNVRAKFSVRDSELTNLIVAFFFLRIRIFRPRDGDQHSHAQSKHLLSNIMPKLENLREKNTISLTFSSNVLKRSSCYVVHTIYALILAKACIFFHAEWTCERECHGFDLEVLITH